MPRLGETVADLLARARSRATPTAQSAPPLSPVADFGSDPGGLTMRLHVPDPLASNAPLVVVLHGCGQTAAGYAAGAGWIELADRHGFVVLCPEQTRANNANLCFNWFEDGDVRRDGGEVASIAQMIRHAVARYDLDPRRVFVTGLSAGGAMAAAMLAAYPELFAAGAVVAGLPYGAASGVNQALSAMRRTPSRPARAWGDKVRAAAPPPARWPRVSIWRGDADTTVDPGAGEALAFQWSDVHGAVETAPEPTGLARHTRRIWRDPAGRTAVELHTIAGLGHGVPIAAGGIDGCGSRGPWILEAGVSSSREITRSWGINAVRRPSPAGGTRPTEDRQDPPSRAPATPTVDAGETIRRALQSAGLMR